MAGHSQFKNIMHRKGAQDAKRAKVFNKLAREISVAAKSGMPDPTANPRLRAAIQAARAQNMPRDRIDRAISAAAGADAATYEEVRYEGYGPGGVALIVQALTDNRNRTASEIRTAFSKHGGTLGETNSVSFQFNRIGQVIYPAAVAGADEVFEAALEAGAENVDSGAERHEVTMAVDDFSAVRDALEARFGTPENAQLTWKPLNAVPVGDDAAMSLIKLLNVLDDNDDVQSVDGNFDISDELMDRLTA